MVTDPCYLREWENNEWEDIRRHKDVQTGKVWQYRVNFENYEEKIIDGLTVNELIKSGRLIDEPGIVDRSYSYNGAAQVTIAEQGGELGINGEGVAFRTGNGDGYYPVYARIEDGVVKEIKISFTE
jgi:hypothetical protein